MLIEERFFRQISEAATGFSPHLYLVQGRVERAMVLYGFPQEPCTGRTGADAR